MAEDKEKKDSSPAKNNPAGAAAAAKELPTLKPGMTVKVHQKITERGPKGDKERVQIFEGIILAHRGGSRPEATITVRKVSEGIGVEKIFPLFSPNVVKIEPIKTARIRQAKPYFLRKTKKRIKETKIT